MPGKRLVEVLEDERPHIGLAYENGVFEKPQTALDMLRLQSKNQVDIECKRRSDEIASIEEQISLIADTLEILTKENKSYNDIENKVPGSERYDPTREEKERIQQAQSCKRQVATINRKSIELKSSIDSMDREQLENLDIKNDNNWS